MQGIPLILTGRDIILHSDTGSGKTLAYVLPLLRILMQTPMATCATGPTASHHRSYARTRQSDSRRDFGVPHIASLLHLLSVPKTQRAPRSGRFVLFISSLASLRTGRSLRPPSSGRVGRRGRAVAAPRSERGSGRVGVHAGSTDRPAGQGVGESEQVSV